jgi:hypothetical protein
MLGQPVMVKPAEAEKNLAWEAAQAAKAAAPPDADLIALGLGGPGDPFAALGIAGVGALPEGPLQLQVRLAGRGSCLLLLLLRGWWLA